MATYQDNDYYLDVDGTDLSSYVISVSLDPSINSVETTAGSGTDHITRGEGLYDHSLSFEIRADASTGYALTLLKGTHTITYGEQGTAVGKPKHVQSFILTASHTTNVNKDMVVYSVTGDAAAAPTTDMFASGVWS
jgi:hypothetical protein